MSEGGGYIPIPAGVNFWPDVFEKNRHAWEGRQAVEDVWLRLGCTALQVAAAWQRGGDSKRELRNVAKAVIGLGISRDPRANDRTRAYQWLKTDKRTADKFFAANPQYLDLARRILDEGYRPPCPILTQSDTENPKGRLRKLLRRQNQAITRQSQQREDPRSLPSQQPRPGTQRPPGPLSQRSLDEYLKLIEALRGWWAQRQQAREQERAAKRAARQQRAYLELFGGAGIQPAPQPAGVNLMGLSDFLTGFGDIIEASAPIATAYLNSQRPTGGSGIPLPYNTGGYGGGYGGGYQPAGLGDLIPYNSPLGQLFNLEPGSAGAATMPVAPSNATLYKLTANGSVVPKRDILAVNPRTGSLQAWGYMGKPILFSRDVNTCRRVRKVARRAASGVGLRFRASGRGRRRR